MLDARIDAGDEVVALQETETGTPGGVDEVAPLAEVADAPHVGVLHVPFEHRLGVRVGQVAFGDNAVRIAGPVGESLQPASLVDRIGDAERGLDVDRLRHVGETDLGDIVLDPVVLRLQRVDVAEKAVDRVRLEPGIAQLRPLQIVQVEMGVDQRNFGHAHCLSGTARISGRGRNPPS